MNPDLDALAAWHADMSSCGYAQSNINYIESVARFYCDHGLDVPRMASSRGFPFHALVAERQAARDAMPWLPPPLEGDDSRRF